MKEEDIPVEVLEGLKVIEILDKIIIEQNLDSDLSYGNYMCISFKKESVSIMCQDPIFNEQIPIELFIKYAQKYGVSQECQHCKYFQKLKKTKASWGTCNWLKEQKPKMPFWADIKEYGSISPEHENCEVFRRVER